MTISTPSRDIVADQLVIGALRRFWPKVDQDGPISEYRADLGRCWLWTTTKTDGYGLLWDGTKDARGGPQKVLAHRFAFLTAGGKIPDHHELDHLCRVRHCVRPAHLEPVTRRENMRRSPLVGKARSAWTHCKNGHQFTDTNTRIDPRSGWRICRACTRNRAAQYQAAKREAIA